MGSTREIQRTLSSRATVEGAGVHLKRALGPNETAFADPFLLLDDFHSANPKDYVAGFPWHPHRGIETVTYMIRGVVEHADSIGNSGVIGSGSVQWMTAGSGILHQEMPKLHIGNMQGFQLWVNLPSSRKMMNPRYRDIEKEQIPTHSNSQGADIRVIAGEIDGTRGPVEGLVVDIEYLDIVLDPSREFVHPTDPANTVIAYVFEGWGLFSPHEQSRISSEQTIIFDAGGDIWVKAGDHGARFLLISGKPLKEPIAWGGPIVMNTEEELDTAFKELRNGTFIRSARSP